MGVVVASLLLLLLLLLLLWGWGGVWEGDAAVLWCLADVRNGARQARKGRHVTWRRVQAMAGRESVCRVLCNGGGIGGCGQGHGKKIARDVDKAVSSPESSHDDEAFTTRRVHKARFNAVWPVRSSLNVAPAATRPFGLASPRHPPFTLIVHRLPLRHPHPAHHHHAHVQAAATAVAVFTLIAMADELDDELFALAGGDEDVEVEEGEA